MNNGGLLQTPKEEVEETIKRRDTTAISRSVTTSTKVHVHADLPAGKEIAEPMQRTNISEV